MFLACFERQARRRQQWFCFRFIAGLLLTIGLAGCGGPQRADPVDVELAKSTMIRVLDHWKNQGSIGDLRSETPEVVVQETLWSDGKQLQDYHLTEDSRAEDATWFCDVELLLVPESGDEPVRKTVTYAVGTDPVLTVFHAML